MGDIRIVWDPVTGTGDFNMIGSGLELGHDLETASLISLFTDAQADPGDIVYDTDPRGTWIYPRQTLTALRTLAMQDMTASDLPNSDGFLRRAVLRVLAWAIAGMAYLHDGYLDWISLQSTPFTATGEYLEGWAALAPTPVLRQAPTFASGPATWLGAVNSLLPANTVCNRGDNVQYVTGAAATVGVGGTVTVTVTALAAGANGNTDSGTPLTFGTAIPGIGPNGAASAPVHRPTAEARLQLRLVENTYSSRYA